MIRLLRLALGVLFLAALAPALGREPSQIEQYYLELVNRARANPGAEVARLAGRTWGDEGAPAAADLNEGLPAGTISPAPKPPLAFDTRLVGAASDYSDHLLATEQFSHTALGTASARMEGAGYVFAPPSAAGENLAITASTGPHPIDAARAEEHHEGLFIDSDVPDRGHRVNLLLPEFREVGVAMRADSDGVSLFGGDFNDVLSTQKFASSAGRIFVTGVIYYDLDGDDFYDPGESAGVLALSVQNGSGATVASGRSFGSGGYSINLHGVPAGAYTLVARDELGAEASTAFHWSGAANVKVDLVDPALLSLPVLGIPRRPDARIGTTASAPIGNEIYSERGADQRLRLVARRPRASICHALVENDGTETDAIRVVSSRARRHYRTLVFRRRGAGYANETAALAKGLVETLQSGEKLAYRIHLSPLRSALGRRGRHLLFLRASSVADASQSDRVEAMLLNLTRRPRR